ncbi:helix-turn-helix transcriptional regulator [Streptomyces sp. 21So2-11]|uniref:helix-turn-helix domain-containing protein n=1 Tax=Streptomyces sp. 21So2-11 TaxID=3144408 RepID=UPI00321976B5
MTDAGQSADGIADGRDGRELTLAQKLSHLFATQRNPQTGRPYTVGDAARVTGVSSSLITQLKSGAKPNPTVKTVEALASLFHVSPSYFFADFDAEEGEKVRASMELIAAVSDNDVRGLAFRANGLSADSLKLIKAVIENARKAEGLTEQ